jgi:TrmH family RNA methyltransferase
VTLSVVLVRTEQPGNIGAAVRALANMGGGRLILIDPRCEVDAAAYALAAGSKNLLDHAITYPSWDAFYAREGRGLRIALTRRAGRSRKVFPLKEKLSPRAEHVYLIFGPEADGLSADDMAYVNYSCYLPTHGEHASLNLAQAVLLACYLAREGEPSPGPDDAAPAVAPFYFPDALIKQWLGAMGFDVNARKRSAYLTLRRLFLQNQPTDHEVRVLESILNQNIRKLLGLAPKEARDD